MCIATVAIKDRIVARNKIKNCLMKIHVAIRTPTKTSRRLNNGSNRIDGTPYIPFKKNATGKAGKSALWRKTFHYFQLQKEEFMEHYHKRSNVESTFGAIKKKFGESVKSKNRVAQENELLCKIISYNITVLIHEMIQLNGTSEFLSFDGLQKEETINQL